MQSILKFLGWFALVFMAATLLLGLSLDHVDDPANLPAQRWATVHRLSGIAAGIAVVLVDSIIITYFVGTSRWCREVVETYGLDGQFILQSNRLKRRTFPIATVSMLVIVAVVALGGAADPAAALRLPPIAGVTWANVHLVGSLAGLGLVSLGFVLCANNVAAHHDVVTAVLAEVGRIRRERGLPVDG